MARNEENGAEVPFTWKKVAIRELQRLHNSSEENASLREAVQQHAFQPCLSLVAYKQPIPYWPESKGLVTRLLPISWTIKRITNLVDNQEISQALLPAFDEAYADSTGFSTSSPSTKSPVQAERPTSRSCQTQRTIF
ncbi:unnamed protein product [Phytophthora lilii]|uniref:Unnamed protein product n=1 Tax=Phytophthora lilii TaxID=2077276 RepID=A0A9W6WNA3_9STRA|nr:unnamed protein product [Phytophthora lilii]